MNLCSTRCHLLLSGTQLLLFETVFNGNIHRCVALSSSRTLNTSVGHAEPVASTPVQLLI